ncbi:enoyl-CoA hydratase/isomerase [Chromobacterium sp. IIBBL 290-4]|uniref:enoyl-CoA hydratase/isomerase n=1 Tax=Chromobacterium sp. IIBBL 290-4 TaxID=2953890 RepID=UPI0020B8C818|nr:enoyl-CoA hydratase/isomerase [Chromobacterium sp. IIBBL 290-4]UTH76443.1 enoyl-CoA hydratase/isomerase [Chromobacterium sp. IIBBL 290-4]
MSYQTIGFRIEGTVAFLTLNRPHAANTMNRLMVEECLDALKICDERAVVVVLEGSDDVFCLGADFHGLREQVVGGVAEAHQPELLYEVWQQLTQGDFVSIAHVRGRANAGGVGFVAACDIVLARSDAQFSLSELIFGVIPACVLPFLIRRVGFQRAHFLTLSTQAVSAEQACLWGLVDAVDSDSQALLRKQLLRLRRLSKSNVAEYKSYMNRLATLPSDARTIAIEQNVKSFASGQVIENICRYVEHGTFPWETH